MPALEIIAVGKLKNDPLSAVFESYKKRVTTRLAHTEIDAKTTEAQLDKIKEKLNPQAALIVLDERGKSFSSRAFASHLQGWLERYPLVQFVIGGSDGLDEDIRKKATILLSFGDQTWPHLLVRVMLMEQIYRAQQITSGHPYHRD